MNRVEVVQHLVDKMLNGLGKDRRFVACRHLYAVSEHCVLLSLKRGENSELACIAGLLHDYYAYKFNDRKEHAHKGAVCARELLESTAVFSEDEVEAVCSAIYHHSDKDVVGLPLDEVLKDADVLSHFLLDPRYEIEKKEWARFVYLCNELNLEDERLEGGIDEG